MWEPFKMPDDPFTGRWFSIDPGEKHFAVAVWDKHECIDAFEATPEEALDSLQSAFKWSNGDDVVTHIVFENWALQGHGGRAAMQVGSEFETVQMIGVLKYLCEQHAVPWVKYLPSVHKSIYKTDWFKALSLKDRRKLAWWGKGTSDHCKDAWCVGMWFRQEHGHIGLPE